MWQALRKELRPLGLEVVTVALDVEPERARPYVEAARPEHPSLIDASHVVDELFGIVNVPSSIWIDESGTIVRPVETASVQPSALETGAMPPSDLPAEMVALAKRIRRDPEAYVAALRDWARNGAASSWALRPEEVVARSAPRSADAAEAAAHFELGAHLHGLGEIEAARAHWREAHRLQPENWTYKRQAWELVDPRRQGRTDVYEGSWIDDVKVLGPESYYPPLRP